VTPLVDNLCLLKKMKKAAQQLAIASRVNTVFQVIQHMNAGMTEAEAH